VLVVHTPPVRRAVLRYVIAEVQRRYGIRIEASRLDYNLAALTVGLADVRIAADRTPSGSFFAADYLHAALARRATGRTPLPSTMFSVVNGTCISHATGTAE
jgi:hypothetical protein